MNQYLLLVLAILGLACSSDKSSNSSSGPPKDARAIDSAVEADSDSSSSADILRELPPVTPVISSAIAIENPANALSYFIEWETDIPVPTVLDVECQDEYFRHFESTNFFTSHSVFVMGLIPGTSCSATITAGISPHASKVILVLDEIGPVPDRFPLLDCQLSDPERMYPGWTFWSLSNATKGDQALIMALDEQCRYRWYHFGSSSIKAGAGKEIQAIEGGLLLAAGGPEYFLGWDGKPFWEAPFDAHHDMRFSPWNENHLLYLAISKKNCETSEHMIVEYNMDSGEQIWNWRICEHYTPTLSYHNWSHVNTIEPFPGERAILVSPRDQDVLLKVNRDTDNIEWVLGWGGDFAMEQEAYFVRQHAPMILENGDILMFDNGLSKKESNKTDEGHKVREYSRALQLHLTFDGNTPVNADIAWDYTDETLYASARSEADRLPNGNTLIAYSQLAGLQNSMMLEVTEDKEIVWQLISPPNWSTYRAERIAPFFGDIRSTVK
jgi:hypothetical protein